MLGESFRPWGELDWLMSKSRAENWHVVGCASFEERCYGLQSRLPGDSVISSLYFNILPPESSDRSNQTKKLARSIDQLKRSGVSEDQILEVQLHDSISNFINPLSEFLASTNGNIILDISSQPKRFFFPILKRIMQFSELNNLLVCYTKPEKYAEGELSWDPADWSHLPMYMAKDYRDSRTQLAIIGVGFVPLGLPDLLIGQYQDAEVKLLFPHPPGPPNYQRNWDFVRRIVSSYPTLSLNDMQRVHALDMSDAFDKICQITNNGAYKTILAPYGPKPMSLAMALFAIEEGVPVYYTQPSYYSADYSSGIKETYAYWVVKSKTKLFTVP